MLLIVLAQHKMISSTTLNIISIFHLARTENDIRKAIRIEGQQSGPLL